MKKSVRNFIKIYWEVLLVVAAGIAGVILLKVKGEDWPAALNFPTEAVAAGYWILILGMTALEGILIFRFLVKGLEYVIYTVLPLWLYLMVASPGGLLFPSLIWTYSLVILIARLVMLIRCRLKKQDRQFSHLSSMICIDVISTINILREFVLFG